MITESLVTAGTNAIVKLGAITVGFFVLLGIVIYILNDFVSGASLVHAEIVDTVKNVEMRQEQRIFDANEDTKLNSYFQKQICFNTARTEVQRIACNPPPALL